MRAFSTGAFIQADCKRAHFHSSLSIKERKRRGRLGGLLCSCHTANHEKHAHLLAHSHTHTHTHHGHALLYTYTHLHSLISDCLYKVSVECFASRHSKLLFVKNKKYLRTIAQSLFHTSHTYKYSPFFPSYASLSFSKVVSVIRWHFTNTCPHPPPFISLCLSLHHSNSLYLSSYLSIYLSNYSSIYISIIFTLFLSLSFSIGIALGVAILTIPSAHWLDKLRCQKTSREPYKRDWIHRRVG